MTLFFSFKFLLTRGYKKIIINNDNIIKKEKGEVILETDLFKIIMNPVRLRIIQYLSIHQQAATGEIGKELSDIPTASLYRHMKILENAGLISVVSENKKRGAVEKIYEMNKNAPLGAHPTQQELGQLINGNLLQLMGEFNQYMEKEGRDLEADMVSMTTSALLLTDQECMDFFNKIGEVIGEVIENKPEKGRKLRRITLISLPDWDRKEE